MVDPQEHGAETGTPPSEVASEFVAWIQHVTHLPAEDYQPRHRADGAAV